MQSGSTVCWSSKKLKSLSEEFVKDPLAIKHIDASDNLLRFGRSLERFSQLQTLIIDENRIQSLLEFPSLPQLQHLSLIKNNISNLDELILHCKQKFPKLTNLNLMKNPEEDYHNYRQTILKGLPLLTNLDGFPVTEKDMKPFVSEIPVIKETEQSGSQIKGVIRQQYIENDQARGVVEHNVKYAQTTQNRNILKGTSQGNKHILNNKL